MSELVAIVSVALGLAVLLAITLYRRASHYRRELARLAQWRRAGKYWGVRIVSEKPGRGCSAASAAGHHIYPISSVPDLPLKGCTKHWCRCRYRPYPDRRRSERRRKGDRRQAIRMEEGSERRSGGGRRRQDATWKGGASEK